jgi:hypothetical protein
MSDKINKINEMLRELKENYGFDLSDPKGITLGSIAYFAFDKRLSLDAKDDYRGSYHLAKIPFENSHIVDLHLGERETPPITIGLTYPSNHGLHLQSAERGAMKFYYQGHDDDLHDTLKKWSMSESKRLHFSDSDSWEHEDGKVISYGNFADVNKHSDEVQAYKPHELQVLFPEESYKYNLLTEQLKKE